MTFPPYAILSHTWTNGAEVTYDELVTGARKDKASYAKIRFCGERAAHDGLQYFWVDTCCIDKSSSAELTEALNCMFRWYQSSAKCYVYLSDVSSSRLPSEDAFLGSRWFIRGWTLQELIAPEVVEFYTADDVLLGDKLSLEGIINKASGSLLFGVRGASYSLSVFSLKRSHFGLRLDEERHHNAKTSKQHETRLSKPSTCQRHVGPRG
jgi:hypothetical protein